jgi:HK97 family phage prohead protease
MQHTSIHRTLLFARAAGAESRTFSFRCSTAEEDSQGRIVAQDWDLERYQKNPVVLWNHGMGGGLFSEGDTDLSLPIGHASNVRVEGGELQADITLVTAEANPIAEKVYQGIVQGSIRAVSVGWRAGEARVEDVDGGQTIILSRNELYEISVVAIPANADAVKLAASFRQSVQTATSRHAASSDSAELAKLRREFAELKASTAQALDALHLDFNVLEKTTALRARHAAEAQEATLVAMARAGKSYAQLSSAEKHELYHRDRASFERLRAAHIEQTGGR